MHQSRSIIVAAIAAIAIASTVTAAVVIAAPTAIGPIFAGVMATPKPSIPPGPATPAELDALVTASRAQHRQYLRDFIASGADPRSLPRVLIPATAPVPESLSEAVRRADVIVRGRVLSTSFAIPADDNVPLATSTVQVVETVKQRQSGVCARLSVLQRGGPVPQANGGGLAQLSTDELILAGDEVILLLQYREDLGGSYRPVPGAGTYFVSNGRVVPEHSNRFGATVVGQPTAAFMAALRAAA